MSRQPLQGTPRRLPFLQPPPAPRPSGRRAVVLLGAVAALWLVRWALGRLAPESAATDLAGLALFLAVAVAVFFGLRWLWRRLTYRVSVRLFLSYLLIGLVPFPLLGLLGLITGYMLVGQYGSIRVGQEHEKLLEHLSATAVSALHELEVRGGDTALALLHVPELEGAGRSLRTLALVADGARAWRAPGSEELAVPAWTTEAGFRGLVLDGDRPYAAVVARHGTRLATLLVPLDRATAETLSRDRWFDLRFVVRDAKPQTPDGKGSGVTVNVGTDTPDGESTIKVDGEEVDADEVEPDWTSRERSGDWWDRLQILWVRFPEPPRSWADGREVSERQLVTLIRVSVGGAARDLFGSQREVGREVITALLIVTAVFAGIYLVAVSFAVVMIVAITRATARLSRGAREVGGGNLDWRIPVKKRDQLGDLALSFNAMSESVKHMLVEVAEKERLAREMELAREIQESLLPRREFNHGGLAVHAHFRPAAEVGGDYFDVFPLAGDRLILTIGDVAGHGLSTGLLMAMVKSAVATLVHDGHRGVSLLENLNELLLRQSVRNRMVTLALLEVDETAGRVTITNTGHPPAFILRPDGELEEVLLSALPLGHRWPGAPASRAVAFPAGSKLVIYSDGLVEAENAAGETYGYEALGELLTRHAGLPAPALLLAILAELDRHTGGTPLADDLTVLVVESAPAAA
jgi:serine phosphatase RsbU (regulator of sigma subunit)